MGAKIQRKAHRKPVPMTSIVMSKATRKKVGAVIGSSAALTMIASTSGASVADQVGSRHTLDVAGVTKDITDNVVQDMGVNDAVAAADVAWASTGSVVESESTAAPSVEIERPAPATVNHAAAQSSDEIVTTNVPNPPSAGVVAYAKNFLGVPYVYGGTTPAGFDCSGFVGYVYRDARGINLPRTTWGIGSAGTRISPSQAVPGDILYYGGHVGIYAGDGMMIHAPRPGRTVSLQPIYGSPSYIRF